MPMIDALRLRKEVVKGRGKHIGTSSSCLEMTSAFSLISSQAARMSSPVAFLAFTQKRITYLSSSIAGTMCILPESFSWKSRFWLNELAPFSRKHTRPNATLPRISKRASSRTYFSNSFASLTCLSN